MVVVYKKVYGDKVTLLIFNDFFNFTKIFKKMRIGCKDNLSL